MLYSSFGPEIKHMIYRARDENAKHFITDAVCIIHEKSDHTKQYAVYTLLCFHFGKNNLKMKIDVIIKFGGSAVTVKDQLETLKEEELLQACALVNICLDHGKTVVVVHGAG